MRRISCVFLCLLPSQSLIPRTSASAAVCPVELKCSATGKPGAFSFNNEFYHQVGGVAMDSKMGPNYACLFVGFIEEQIGQQYTGAAPQLHQRYIDDVVGIACCNHVELEDYIAFVFNFHPALQFTHTISETELPFLISICAFLVTASALPSTTKPLIHTASSTTIHHIPPLQR